jgi:hypothetical protein
VTYAPLVVIAAGLATAHFTLRYFERRAGRRNASKAAEFGSQVHHWAGASAAADANASHRRRGLFMGKYANAAYQSMSPRPEQGVSRSEGAVDRSLYWAVASALVALLALALWAVQ